MHYTLRQLEVFVAIARHDNVSRAAEHLALSQSAASMALAELERQFDVRLFDRTGRALRLNEAGRCLLPQAIDLLERAAGIEALLHGQGGFGPLSIGATLTIGHYLATPIVAEFLQRHPESRVTLTIHNTATIVQAVASHDLDLGLIEGYDRHPDVTGETWRDDELVVFCAPGHPLAGQDAPPVEVLAEQMWILREPGSGTRETFDMAMRPYRHRLNIRLELEHTEAIRHAVAAGLGLGCLSALALRESFACGTLLPIPTPELDLRRQFRFIRHRQKFESAGLRAFIELCRQDQRVAAGDGLV